MIDTSEPGAARSLVRVTGLLLALLAGTACVAHARPPRTAADALAVCRIARVDTTGWREFRNHTYGVRFLAPAAYNYKQWTSSFGDLADVESWWRGGPGWTLDMDTSSYGPFTTTPESRARLTTYHACRGTSGGRLLVLETYRTPQIVAKGRPPRSDAYVATGTWPFGEGAFLHLTAYSVDSATSEEQIAIIQSLRFLSDLPHNEKP